MDENKTLPTIFKYFYNQILSSDHEAYVFVFFKKKPSVKK